MENEITEEHGIKCIIALQSMGGVVETEEQAKAGWASMSESDRKTTVDVHQRMFGDSDESS